MEGLANGIGGNKWGMYLWLFRAVWVGIGLRYIILGDCMMSPLAAARLLLDHMLARIMLSMLGHFKGLGTCRPSILGHLRQLDKTLLVHLELLKSLCSGAI